jgi:glutamyl-tRNA synthetase
MSHIPLIHGPDGSKLSKRHGALGVDAYRAMGYLPAAMRNYLVRLGWSHGDQEMFTTEEMVAAFDLAHIGRSPARFDFAKLENLNGHYIRTSNDADLLAALEQLLPHIAGGQDLASQMTPALRAKLTAAMPGLKERAKTLVELFDASRFVWTSRPLDIHEQAKALLTPEAKATIAALLPELEAAADWTAAAAEAVVRGFADRTGVKLGAVAQPLRAALTGRTTSPPIFDVLAVLGKEESLGRLRDQATPA